MARVEAEVAEAAEAADVKPGAEVKPPTVVEVVDAVRSAKTALIAANLRLESSRKEAADALRDQARAAAALTASKQRLTKMTEGDE
jgi:hypothetical protein